MSASTTSLRRRSPGRPLLTLAPAGRGRGQGEGADEEVSDRGQRNFALSARLRGEREGTRRGVGLQPTDLIRGDGEGEVGHAAITEPGLPHLTPTLSAPRGGEGGFNNLFYIGSKMCESRSP